MLEIRQFIRGNTSSVLKGVIVKVINSNLHLPVFVLGSTLDLICASLHLEDN